MGSLMKNIFLDSQRSESSHPKLIRSLTKFYLKSNRDKFTQEFIQLTKHALVVGEKQPTIERVLNFVARFTVARKDEVKGPVQEGAEEEEVEEELDVFVIDVIKFLLNNHEASSAAVRFRVCQMVNRVLAGMGEEAALDDDLFSDIYDTMMHRLIDKKPAVRVQAVLALARLQEPRSKDCQVLKAYEFHLANDPNPEVRRAVLTSIAITFRTLPFVLERTRDVREIIRRQAFQVISCKVHLKSLTIAQRVMLISEGLKDRSESVRSAVEKNLLTAWLGMLDGSVLDLLACLDVEASVSEAETALNAIFKHMPTDKLIENFNLALKGEGHDKLVPIDKLKPESALYWHCLVKYFRKEGMDEAVEEILPELTPYCAYLNTYFASEVENNGDVHLMAVKCLEKEFTTRQLVALTTQFDLSDEMGRKSLDLLIKSLLLSDRVGEAIVKPLLEAFGKLHPPATRINLLVEIISEIRQPLTRVRVVEQQLTEEELRTKKIKVAGIRSQISEVREELEECVRNLNLQKAQDLKERLLALDQEQEDLEVLQTMEVDETQEPIRERDDPATLIKCLTIVSEMIASADVTLSATLQSLHENLVLPSLGAEDPAVRREGIKALGLLCLLSPDLARKHLLIFLQISQLDIEELQETALKSAFNLIHFYGLEEFEDIADDVSEATGSSSSNTNDAQKKKIKKGMSIVEDGESNIIANLCQLLDSESESIRNLTTEGLCKLLLSSRITSPKLISNLIVNWFNPITEENAFLRHMLGVFFPVFASIGGANQEALCAAFLPTLRTIFSAPARSPLVEVNGDEVASFLVSITAPFVVKDTASERVNIHDTLVFTLCNEILANPDQFWTRSLIRCLNLLSLTQNNYIMLRQLDVLAVKMLKRVRERQCSSGLQKFLQSVQKLLKDAPEEGGTEGSNVSGDLSAVDITVAPAGFTIASESSMDITAVRRKRILYNSMNSELLSSEADSEEERSAPSNSPTSSLAISDISSPKFTSTQINDGNEKEKNVFGSIATRQFVPEMDTEFELNDIDISDRDNLSPIVEAKRKSKVVTTMAKPIARKSSRLSRSFQTATTSNNSEIVSDDMPTRLAKSPYKSRDSSEEERTSKPAKALKRNELTTDSSKESSLGTKISEPDEESNALKCIHRSSCLVDIIESSDAAKSHRKKPSLQARSQVIVTPNTRSSLLQKATEKDTAPICSSPATSCESSPFVSSSASASSRDRLLANKRSSQNNSPIVLLTQLSMGCDLSSSSQSATSESTVTSGTSRRRSARLSGRDIEKEVGSCKKKGKK